MIGMCTKPLLIVNPRYKKLAEQGKCSVRRFSLQPDYKILVPCGHCSECLSKRKQQWFSRAQHLFDRMHLEPEQCLFCTFTLRPEVYEAAKEKPYIPIRRFLDRLRKHPRFIIGMNKRGKPVYRKVKFPYLFVVEFADGKRAEERGLPSTHRMHYHAILFNPPLYWWQIRDLWKCNGIATVEPMKSMAGVNYTLKYMFKDCSSCQYLSDVDARKNGKLIVSHRFGRLSKEDIRIMRENMLKSEQSWFCHFINNFRYSIPRYWKNQCFTKEEQKCINDTLVPPLIWKSLCRKYSGKPDKFIISLFNYLIHNGTYVLIPQTK